MKITGIKTYWLKVPYDKPFEPTWYPGKRETHQHILLVRVMTDEGIEGYGSGEFPFGLTPTYMTFIQDMIAPWLIGQDPLMIEKLATRLKGDGRLAPRPWIVENALWDILGKKAGLPTYKVMGGYRDHIPAYAAMCELRSDEERQEDALRLFDEGFRAVKLRLFMPTIKEDIHIVENIRKAVGDKMTIICDANQGPVRDRNFEGGRVPFWTYQRALETNITLCCGISHVRKIAAMAERRGNKLVNIHGWVPGTGVAAALATICSYPNATWLEVPHDPPAITPDSFQGIVKEPLRINKADGCLYCPDKPGFGVELDEDKVKAYTVLEK